MRIYYHLSAYISHRKSGLDYIDCLKSLGHTVFLDPADAAWADFAVIHDDPLNYPAVLSAVPALADKSDPSRARGVPWIAYAVWEGDLLPEAYISNLARANAVWTCSHYCREGMLPHFPHTKVVPHVVRKRVVSKEVLEGAKELISSALAKSGAQPSDNGQFFFFSVVDSVNPRKNVVSLLSAFAALKAQTGKDRPVRLLLKQYRVSLDFQTIPDVINIADDLTDEEMAALHMLSNCYVSAHHAEGWGLGLSEAMAYGKPVIATGYSGNMEFMDTSNSFPVPYTLVPVSEEMCRLVPLFNQKMKWANINQPDFISTMSAVLDGRCDRALPGRAVATARRFGMENVALIINERIREFVDAREKVI